MEADLTAVWGQISRWLANREVERTIPQVRFTEATEIIKLPLGLRHIMAREAVVLEQAVQACELTYGEWYKTQLTTVTFPVASCALSVYFPALMTSFGLDWNLDVITDEFELNRDQVKKQAETLDLMTVNEVLALELPLGPTKFVAHPLAIVFDLEEMLQMLQQETS